MGTGTEERMCIVRAALVVLGALLLTTAHAGGQSTTWVAGDGYWAVPENWSNGEPNASMDAYITPGPYDCIVVTIPYDNAYCDTLWISSNIGSGVTLQILAAGLDCNDLYLGGGLGWSRVEQTAGGVSIDYDLHVGYNGTGPGEYAISGGGSLGVQGNTYVGAWSGSDGNFVQGGSASVTFGLMLYVGYDEGAGTYTLNGGSLLVDYASIGWGGNGYFVQTGGSSLVACEMVLGTTHSGLPGCGRYELSGGSLGEANALYVGFSNTGVFVQSGGYHRTSCSLFLGFGTDGDGNYSLTDGNLSIGDNLVVADSGLGLFEQSGAAVLHVEDDLVVGRLSSAAGTFALSGGSLGMDGNWAIADTGTGTFIQSGGQASAGGNVFIAWAGSSDGNYTMTGGTLDANGNICIGGGESSAGGSGWMHVDGGTATVGGVVKVWSGGTLNLGAGTLQHANPNLYVDIQSDGLLRVTSASHAAGSVTGIDANLIGTTQIDAEAALSVSKIVQGTVTIDPNATLTIRGSSKTTSIINSLSIDANGGVMDLDSSNDVQGNWLVLPGADYDTVAEWVRSGRNDGSGVWDGPGIMTSVGQDSNNPVAVGVIDNAQFTYTTFGDATGLDGNEVLLKCTWLEHFTLGCTLFR